MPRQSDVPYESQANPGGRTSNDAIWILDDDGHDDAQSDTNFPSLDEIRPGRAFWTDGICIPKAENVRKNAIGMMARTYGEAVAAGQRSTTVPLHRAAQCASFTHPHLRPDAAPLDTSRSEDHDT